MIARATLVAAAAAVALAGCGGSGAPSSDGALGWKGSPQVFAPRDLPRDRVVVGKVRNTSKRTIHLMAAQITIHDARGRRLRGAAGFTAAFAHGLFGAFQQPSKLPATEAARLGRDIYLSPNTSVPFFAAWRLAPGSREPARIVYPGGSLGVPRAVRATAP